jgi:predicted deacylase
MSLPELAWMQRIFADSHGWLTWRELAGVAIPGREGVPIVALTAGTEDRAAPAVVITAGVHGLERVGTHVVLAWLQGLVAQRTWDAVLRDELEALRLVIVPVVNPGGMLLDRRSNPRGVDLMRNAPVESERATWLVGGHRLGELLPWYRGRTGEAMEVEAAALCRMVEDAVFPHEFALALDVHSGFGRRDRLWYPFARAAHTFPREREARALQSLLDRALPNHVYEVEPQASRYTTHGDLWDHLFDRHALTRAGAVFLPWTLEMGSWSWLPIDAAA